MADLSALSQVPLVGQFALHGSRLEERRCVAPAQMPHQYSTAQQIADDRTDWLGDLQKGCLNYVSSLIASRMVEGGAAESYTKLDAHWIAGYFLYDDDLFAEIQQVALAACRRSAQSIAGTDSVYLGELVSELAGRLEVNYEAASDSRSKLRALFPLAPGVRAGT
jgi:hypothetical protein